MVHGNHKVIPNSIHIFDQYFDLLPEATEAMTFIKGAWQKYLLETVC